MRCRTLKQCKRIIIKESEIFFIRITNSYGLYQMNSCLCLLDWAQFLKSTILIEYPIMTLNCFIHIAIVSGCSCVVLIGNCDMLKVSYYYTGILHPHTLSLTHTSSSFMPSSSSWSSIHKTDGYPTGLSKCT